LEELSEDKKKLQAMTDSTDVLNTSEEIKKYNNLIEKSELTIPKTIPPSADGN